ncbi:hypothetical protein LEL_08455 [Akanthomyces lecanii RCEF 1005]|uniref:C6 finger domain protein n=1 Tax=Akanthomyces lecanii RCEF 1005 TaxID=1081108 RepID=A0A168DJ04_CORDF|nr:hypothetical protein LEL_08455 [Akanthomyces lecanii RCEF 1005]
MAQRPSGTGGREDKSKAVVVRQRKTHRKSRLGCANCKLRGVKPRAGGHGGSAAAAKADDAADFALGAPYSREYGQLCAAAERQGAREADAHKSRCMMLANAHKYLYHIYIGFAQLQDAHFNVVPGSPRPSDGATMALHMYHSATMFKQTLSELMPRKKHISSMERDALWMGASMLATSCFANIDSLDPREVWPLRAPDMMDLDWLRMNQGKDIVWEIADLGRSDSVFNDFFVEMATTPLPSASSPIRPHALSPLFYTLFDISPSSTAESNVYHGAVSYLSQIIDDEVTIYIGARLFIFPMEVGVGVKKLLRARDPRAMLLLVYWHSKLVEYPAWWVKFRCIVEGLAIAMHLRREHAEDMPDLIRLLEPPRQALLAQFRKSKLTQVWPQEVVDEAEAPYM